MASDTLKTKKTNKSVSAFLRSIPSKEKRDDSKMLISIFKELTGKPAVMWGPTMIGFGTYQYSRRDGSKHKYFAAGFSPRKENLTIYIMPGFAESKELLAKLGPHKKSVGCLYIKRLSDIHLPTLTKIIKSAVDFMRINYLTDLKK